MPVADVLDFDAREIARRAIAAARIDDGGRYRHERVREEGEPAIVLALQMRVIEHARPADQKHGAVGFDVDHAVAKIVAGGRRAFRFKRTL